MQPKVKSGKIAGLIVTYKMHKDFIVGNLRNMKESTNYLFGAYSKVDKVEMFEEMSEFCDETFVFEQPTFGKRQDQYAGETICTREGLRRIKENTDCEFVWKMNGNWVLQNPLNPKIHLKYLEDCEIYSTCWSIRPWTIHCGWFFGRIDSLIKVYDKVRDIPPRQLEHELQEKIEECRINHKIINSFNTPEYIKWKQETGIVLIRHKKINP